ncbi:hypothetical protein BaRGS_00025557 [Batillaria attramentaria]|uniref:Uncharacterized protein n=1 Tax=Batillaria attramentaria TaxID=370345 RepID=A0ABD0K7J5_9CAEN
MVFVVIKLTTPHLFKADSCTERSELFRVVSHPLHTPGKLQTERLTLTDKTLAQIHNIAAQYTAMHGAVVCIESQVSLLPSVSNRAASVYRENDMIIISKFKRDENDTMTSLPGEITLNTTDLGSSVTHGQLILSPAPSNDSKRTRSCQG